MLTGETITDEQIRELRAMLERLAEKIGEYDVDARDEAITDAGLCTRALAVSASIPLPVDRGRIRARARVADIINARRTAQVKP